MFEYVRLRIMDVKDILNTVICGDNLPILRQLPDKCVDLILTDLQLGKAGEYLVCADLILKGHIAFPSEQGLSFEVVFARNRCSY
jgi:hypothetical protein